MKTRFLIVPIVMLLCLVAANLYAQTNAQAIVGVWFNEEKDAKIKVYEENGKFFGKIVWHRTGDDVSNFDDKNPDPELKKRKKIGLILLENFEFSGGQWEDGTIYDPKSGKTYSCVIKMEKDGSLHVRGYIGISLIGRTTYWTRTE
jgi:uncharacterized protein (DUF2147 family)